MHRHRSCIVQMCLKPMAPNQYETLVIGLQDNRIEVQFEGVLSKPAAYCDRDLRQRDFHISTFTHVPQLDTSSCPDRRARKLQSWMSAVPVPRIKIRRHAAFQAWCTRGTLFSVSSSIASPWQIRSVENAKPSGAAGVRRCFALMRGVQPLDRAGRHIFRLIVAAGARPYARKRSLNRWFWLRQSPPQPFHPATRPESACRQRGFSHLQADIELPCRAPFRCVRKAVDDQVCEWLERDPVRLKPDNMRWKVFSLIENIPPQHRHLFAPMSPAALQVQGRLDHHDGFRTPAFVMRGKQLNGKGGQVFERHVKVVSTIDDGENS